jgi:hypothetical protein
MMRLLTVLLAAFTAAFGLVQSAEMSFDRSALALAERDGMTTVTLGRCVSTWETGAPALPIAVAQLVVPQDMKVTGVRLEAVETETITGAVSVYPVQPPAHLSAAEMPAFVPPDPEYYGSVFPREIVTAGHQGSMSGYNIASVLVAPVQYDGASGTLIFHHRVRFTLELEAADLGYLRPGNRGDEARRRIEARVASIVLNPQDVSACAPR